MKKDELERKFFSVIKPFPNEEQQAAIKSVGNTLVSAGAGSGKTEVLALRFSYLVLVCGIKCEKILVLTFTNKAADEMHARIYKKMREFSENKEIGEVIRNAAKNALLSFSRTHIQTLDSYAASLVRRAAHLYGLNADFRINDSEIFERTKTLALKFVIKNLENEAFQYFIDGGNAERFASKIFAELASFTHPGENEGKFKSFLEKQKKEAERAKFAILGECENILCALKKAISNYKETKYTKSLFLSAQKFDEAENEDEKICALDFVASVKKSGGKSTAEITEIKKMHDFCRTAHEKIKSLVVFLNSFPILQNFCAEIDDFSLEVLNIKRRAGILTFSDVNFLALKILKSQKDILDEQRAEFDKIMIDEFQDNNAMNGELLLLLADDKEKLFFVGDAKQSIYRFNGADVAVFNSLSQKLKVPFLTMRTNYRSSAELVAFFNLFFKKLFFSTEKRDYEASYTEADEAVKRDKNGKVTIKSFFQKEEIASHFLLFKKEADEDFLKKDEAAAFYTAAKIRSLYDAGSPFASFAVLERTRSKRYLLEKWLTLFDIPYTVDQKNSLFRTETAQDFLSLIKLAVYPFDTHAAAVFLHSPFVMMSMNGVLECLALYKKLSESDEFLSFFDEKMKENLPPSLSKADKEKFLLAADLYKKEGNAVFSRPISETLRILWQQSTYRVHAALSDFDEGEFEVLFSLASRADSEGKSAAWFSEECEKLSEADVSFMQEKSALSLEGTEYFLSHDADAVQIMTVHKSKGLEFDNVFVIGLFDKALNDKEEEYFFDEKFGFSFKMREGKNYFFQIEKEENERRTQAEFLRLIYVAFTRAKNSLFIAGEIAGKKEKSDSRSELEKIVASFFPNLENEEIESEKFYNSSIPFDVSILPAVSTFEAKKEAARFSHFAASPKILFGKEEILNCKSLFTPSSVFQKISPSHFGDVPSETSGIRANEKAILGTLSHEMICFVLRNGKIEDYEADEKLLFPFTDGKKTKLLNEVAVFASSFIKSDFAKEYFDAKKNERFTREEWAFKYVEDDRVVSGVMDLIFEKADGTFVIVDYKSDEGMDAFSYVKQQKCYAKAASLILKIDMKKIKSILYFLRHNKAVDISDKVQS